MRIFTNTTLSVSCMSSITLSSTMDTLRSGLLRAWRAYPSGLHLHMCTPQGAHLRSWLAVHRWPDFWSGVSSIRMETAQLQALGRASSQVRDDPNFSVSVFDLKTQKQTKFGMLLRAQAHGSNACCVWG